MEAKPFDVNVVLIIPGAVKSNIADKALASGVHVPDGSLYKSYEPQIVSRVLVSQGASSMPSDEFARRIVNATLAVRPPRSIMIGGSTTYWKIFAWLPKTMVLDRLWNIFLKVRE